MSREESLQETDVETVDVDDITETRERIQSDIENAKNTINEENVRGYIQNVEADGDGGLVFSVKSPHGTEQFRMQVADEEADSGVSTDARRLEDVLDAELKRPDTFIGSEVVVSPEHNGDTRSMVTPKFGTKTLISRDLAIVGGSDIFVDDGLIVKGSLLFGVVSGLVSFVVLGAFVDALLGAAVGAIAGAFVVMITLFMLLARVPAAELVED